MDLERFFPQLLVPVQPASREDSLWRRFYAFDAYFWQPAGEAKRGIGVFFNFGASDGKANPIEYSYAMGIGGPRPDPRTPAPGSATTSCPSCATRSASTERTRSRSSTTPRSRRGSG